MDGRQVTAVFPDSHRASAARDRLIAAGAPAADMVVRDATVTKAEETAGEGRFMGHVVLVVHLKHHRQSCRWWSRRGDFAHDRDVGIDHPDVSWAIFAHLLIGLWAGYLRLADRSGREIGAGRPVILTVCCGTIDETFLAGQLRALGATGVEAGEHPSTGQRYGDEMANTFKIGDLDVTVLSDGTARAPGTVYFQGTTAEQWEPHKRWLDHQGNVEFPFTCFVVRSGNRTVLIDTGLGPVNMFGFTGGALLTELAAAGFAATDIDTVFVTHLHVDHCGNVALPEGQAYAATFPKATYRWSSVEDEFWRKASGPQIPAVLQPMFAAVGDHYEIANDGDTIGPGVTVIGTPGHTPGHSGIVLSSGGERAFILGDAISCPVQLEQPEWSGMGDMDKDLARRTQEAVVREAERQGALLTAAHFPGLTFGRVLKGQGKRYWEAVSA